MPYSRAFRCKTERHFLVAATGGAPESGRNGRRADRNDRAAGSQSEGQPLVLRRRFRGEQGLTQDLEHLTEGAAIAAFAGHFGHFTVTAGVAHQGT